jgi:hypothetical protein
MNAVTHTESYHIERSRGVGMSCAKPRVALSAKTRADYRAVGFPLQSLTRNAEPEVISGAMMNLARVPQ